MRDVSRSHARATDCGNLVEELWEGNLPRGNTPFICDKRVTSRCHTRRFHSARLSDAHRATERAHTREEKYKKSEQSRVIPQIRGILSIQFNSVQRPALDFRHNTRIRHGSQKCYEQTIRQGGEVMMHVVQCGCNDSLFNTERWNEI